jgi:NTE family protein
MAAAQHSESHFTQREYTERPKIGIALSGGSAHGLAHIGVIQYLDEIGMNIDYITGTSMGAVIGALHAMGYDGKQMEEIAADINWDAVINNNIRYEGVSPIEKFHHDKYPLKFVINDRRILLPQGLLNTNRLELVLARLFSPTVGIDQFADLPRPFRCFGVDIETGEVVSVENGKVND